MNDEKKPPVPLEWHPAYRGYTELLEWLNKPDGPHTLKVPRIKPVAATMNPVALYPVEPSPEPWLLTKRKATGPAPYVGRPFAYWWRFATDQLGRAIAGESFIVYDAVGPRWLAYLDSKRPANEPMRNFDFGMDAP